jgi:hypothetical protein
VLRRHGIVTQRLSDAVLDDLGGLGQLHRPQLFNDQASLLLRRFGIFLGLDGLQHRCYFLHLADWHRRPDVAVEVHHAALPLRLGIEVAEVLDQPKALVRHEELDALQLAVLQAARRNSVQLALSSWRLRSRPGSADSRSAQRQSPVVLALAAAQQSLKIGKTSRARLGTTEQARNPVMRTR